MKMSVNKRSFQIIGLVGMLVVFSTLFWSCKHDDSDSDAPWVFGTASSNPGNFVNYNGAIYFFANGNELWSYNGVSDPVKIVKVTAADRTASNLTVFNDRLYFTYDDGSNGNELWVFDFVNAPAIVSNIYPGCTSGANGTCVNNSSNPAWLTVFNGKLYFSARDGANNTELWAYDGIGLPAPVANIHPTASSYPKYLTVFNGKLYFSAMDGVNGTELWVYDGVSAPSMVANISAAGESNPASLIVFDGRLYFSATDGANGSELWSYDGFANPSMVANINPTGSSQPSSFAVFNGMLYFSADDGVHGRELWGYSGSGSPGMAANMVPDTAVNKSSAPVDLTVANNRLFFTAVDSALPQSGNRILYVYDGVNPPVPIAINAGRNYRPGTPIALNTKILFPASLSPGLLYFGSDNELCVYDTETGMPGILNLNPGIYPVFQFGVL